MEAISHIGITNGSSRTGTSRALEPYRRGLPQRALPRRDVSPQVESGSRVSAGSIGDFSSIIGKARGLSSASSSSSSSSTSSGSSRSFGSSSSSGSLSSMVPFGQSRDALEETRGVFSENFISRYPLFSPAPRALPLVSESSGGDLSSDLLRALQRYRVAAEIQG